MFKLIRIIAMYASLVALVLSAALWIQSQSFNTELVCPLAPNTSLYAESYPNRLEVILYDASWANTFFEWAVLPADYWDVYMDEERFASHLRTLAIDFRPGGTVITMAYWVLVVASGVSLTLLRSTPRRVSDPSEWLIAVVTIALVSVSCWTSVQYGRSYVFDTLAARSVAGEQ